MSPEAMRQLLEDLVEAYREGMRLLQRAVIARATAREMELLARMAVDEAAAKRDQVRIERAMTASAAATRAAESETQASAQLALHRLTAEGALGRAHDVIAQLAVGRSRARR